MTKDKIEFTNSKNFGMPMILTSTNSSIFFDISAFVENIRIGLEITVNSLYCLVLFYFLIEILVFFFLSIGIKRLYLLEKYIRKNVKMNVGILFCAIGQIALYIIIKSILSPVPLNITRFLKDISFNFLFQFFHYIYTKYLGVQLYKLKKDVYRELFFFAFFINLACFLIYEYNYAFVWFTCFFDVLIMLAFLKESIVISDNLQKQGELVEDGIIRFKKFVFKEYMSILKVKSMNLDLNYNSKETQGFNVKLEKNFSDYTDFFYHKWFFVLHQTDIPFSFNIIVENGSFEIFLIFKIKTVLFRKKTVVKKINTAINMLTSSISSQLDYQLKLLEGKKLSDALGRLTFTSENFISEGEKRDINRIKKTERRGMYYNGNKYLSILKFDLKRYLELYYNQRYKKKVLINFIIDSLLKGNFNARYVFNMKIFSFHRKRMRMKKIYKPKPGELEENKFEIFKEDVRTRNFVYLLEDLQVFGSVIVYSENYKEIEELNEKIAGIIHGSWEVPLKRFCHLYEARNIINPGYLNLRMLKASDYQMYKFFHIPTIPSRTQEKSYRISLDAPPEAVCNTGKINIGKVLQNSRPVNDFMLTIDELKRHVFICGGTGTGKSSFVQNLLDEMHAHFNDIPFLLIELKGEYSWLKNISNDLLFLEPGVNFGINLFDPLLDPKIHAEQVFDIFKSSFDFTEGAEFSPQMEKILVDVITITASDPDWQKRNFDHFFKNAKKYISTNKNKIPYLEKSWIAIENRIRRLAVGSLKKVFDSSSQNLSFDKIMKKRVIINLNNIIKSGGTKSDLFFFSNMLLKNLWDHNLIKGPSRKLNHITIIEDSQYFSQSPIKSSSGRASYFEDIALLLRGTGEVLVSISTRPDVSNNVLSNCGLVVAFQSKLLDDVQKLQGVLHLSEEQRSILEILPVHTALVKMNSYPYPFLLKTKTLFDHQEKQNIAKINSDGNNFSKRGLKEKLSRYISTKFKKKRLYGEDFDSTKDEIEIKRDFLSKIKKYYELKEKIWNNFRDTSVKEIKENNKAIKTLKEDLLDIVEKNQKIKEIIENSKHLQPRIENLEKFSREISAINFLEI